MSGPFQKYWETNGGLAIFGYPISEPFHEISKTNGRDYLVQYFERNRFEYHPENAGTPNEILLGLLGSEQTTARRAAREAPFNKVPLAQLELVRHFTTGHTLTPPMSDYWDANGGLPIFGEPISEPFQEKSLEDGKTYLVQYFERNRFEYHPDNPDPYKILLGRLGVIAMQDAGRQP